MQQGQVTELDTPLALMAASLGVRHKLLLADSIVCAPARNGNATLWTQDAAFEGLPHVRYFVEKR